ncbi:class II aldolase/adducin family protein [Wukongibacter baidiensis]|uniref:class II aldolase/adducin family protein n=1 Tax=Wukongibacter baidiensis TaxID=1723361 RepID=UPI003D7F651A
MDKANICMPIINTIKKLNSMGLGNKAVGSISRRIDNDFIAITPAEIDLRALTMEDIVFVNIKNLACNDTLKPTKDYQLHADIYMSRPNISSILLGQSKNTCAAAKVTNEIPPILDDMAQIIGPTIRVANYENAHCKKSIKNVIRALRGRYAALLADGGAICLGRSLEETIVTWQVLEKSCIVYIESKKIGGAIPINRFIAYVMHHVYLRVYSKRREKKKV